LIKICLGACPHDALTMPWPNASRAAGRHREGIIGAMAIPSRGPTAAFSCCLRDAYPLPSPIMPSRYPHKALENSMEEKITYYLHIYLNIYY